MGHSLVTKVKDSNSICLRTEDGEVEKDHTAVAELLVNHFSSAAASIEGDHVCSLTEDDHENHSIVKAIRSNYNDNDNGFDFKNFRKEEVQYAVENINPRKVCSWDPSAPPKLLNEVAKGVAPSFTRLYNGCIELNQWPSEWKKGEWTPAFKKGDRQDKLNYRPTTLLICVDKIFEHLLSKQVTRHYDHILSITR